MIQLPTFADDQVSQIEDAFTKYFNYATLMDGDGNLISATTDIDTFIAGKISDWIDNIVLEQANRDAIANIDASVATPAKTAMTAMKATLSTNNIKTT